MSVESDQAIAAARATVASAGAPLPWLAAPLRAALAMPHRHALLLQAAGDAGQFELALTLAQGWLCEDLAVALGDRPCGHCASCRLVQARSHPDLLVVVPEAMREPLGWRLGKQDFDGDGEGKAGKRKPSREIRIEDIRAVIEFAATTSARGRCKVVVIHPAERLNDPAGNAFLKTLEEPAGDARFLLCASAPGLLLPTVRSRCQVLAVPLPGEDVGVAWLAAQGIAEPAVLLRAGGGQPFAALALAALGLDSKRWAALPRAVGAGDAAALRGLPLALVVETLQKLAHDVAAARCGAPTRYFADADTAPGAGLARLLPWIDELRRIARDADHPWSAELGIETLVAQGREALQTPRPAGRGRGGASLHSSP